MLSCFFIVLASNLLSRFFLCFIASNLCLLSCFLCFVAYKVVIAFPFFKLLYCVKSCVCFPVFYALLRQIWFAFPFFCLFASKLCLLSCFFMLYCVQSCACFPVFYALLRQICVCFPVFLLVCVKVVFAFLFFMLYCVQSCVCFPVF